MEGLLPPLDIDTVPEDETPRYGDFDPVRKEKGVKGLTRRDPFIGDLRSLTVGLDIGVVVHGVLMDLMFQSRSAFPTLS